ncbi:MAG: NrdH-redoxin [Candidatus Aenigmarchaeota archaeon]|nr:NrdH-redoxin [Candidatus Aenigmarchaeota archaeon]
MEVTVYGAEWCPWCHKVKDFLKTNKVKFDDRNVDELKWAKEAFDKSGQAGIPVTDINGDIVIGYDVQTLKKLLKLK